MELFENDVINITNIYSVLKAVTSEESVKNNKTVYFSPNLPTYELVFFVSNEGKTTFDGVEMIDKVNSIRYLPKGKHDGEYKVIPTKAGYCIDVFFSTDVPMPQKAMSFDNMEFLKSKFIKLYNIWEERRNDYYINSMMIFYDIIKAIKSAKYEYMTERKNRKIIKAYEYIQENFKNKDFNYNELCNAAGFSSSYFRDSFLKYYHATPTQIITKMRMEYARELILTKRYKVNEIAELCGFENIYYFSTVFKKFYGMAPSKFDAALC